MAMTIGTLKDTPALDALKASCGAPISMGRGEIPVRLAATSRLFCLRFKSMGKQKRTLGSVLLLAHPYAYHPDPHIVYKKGGVAYDRS